MRQRRWSRFGRRERARFALVTAWVATHAAGVAASEERSALPVRVTYHDDVCTTADAFREIVWRRAPDLVAAAGGEPAREFVARVERGGDGKIRGTLDISEPQGARITRRLEGDDCVEVTEALAFIVAELGRALHLDSDPVAGPVEEAPLGTSLTPVGATARSASPTRPDHRPSSSRVRFESGLGIQAVSAPAPTWLAAPIAYLELGRYGERSPPLVSGRASLAYGKTGTLEGEIGDSEIRWLAVRAELCGPRLQGGAFSLGACASFDVGQLEGKGSGSEDPRTQASVWLAPGLLGRARLAVERTVVFGLEVGGFVPLVKPTFYFAGATPNDARETVHTVPGAGFYAGLSGGVLFP